MSNYPAGVSASHPYFNPDEVPIDMLCKAEEALVVPSFAVKEALIRIFEMTGGLDADPKQPTKLGSIARRVDQLQKLIDEMEIETDYECHWEGELELPVSDHTEWDCPRCGVAQIADTDPEGGR